MKLYKVEIHGGFSSHSTDYHTSYVVAADPTSAYKIVREFLDKEDLCFRNEREMKSVELIADTEHYGDCRTLLFLAKGGGA